MITVEAIGTGKREGTTLYGCTKRYRTAAGARKYAEKLSHKIDGLPYRVVTSGGPEPRTRDEKAPAVGIVATGDIFRCSWGYNMTLVNFYEVTEISDSGRTAIVREIDSSIVEGSGEELGGGYTVKPYRGADRFHGKPMRKRLRSYRDDSACFRVASYANAYLMTPDELAEGCYENPLD